MYEGRLQAGEADYNAWNQAGVHTVLAAKVGIIAIVIVCSYLFLLDISP